MIDRDGLEVFASPFLHITRLIRLPSDRAEFLRRDLQQSYKEKRTVKETEKHGEKLKIISYLNIKKLECKMLS